MVLSEPLVFISANHAFDIRYGAVRAGHHHRIDDVGPHQYAARRGRAPARREARGAPCGRRTCRLRGIDLCQGMFSDARRALAHLVANIRADSQLLVYRVPRGAHVAQCRRAPDVATNGDRAAHTVCRDATQSESNSVRRHDFSVGCIRRRVNLSERDGDFHCAADPDWARVDRVRCCVR